MRTTNIVAVGAGGAILAAGLLAGPGQRAGEASSHVDTPLTIANQKLDGTDLYAFSSPDAPDTVTFVMDYNPLQAQHFQEEKYQFETNGYYDLNVDTDGDAKPEIVYRWKFDGGSLLSNVAQLKDPFTPQRYTVTETRPGQPTRTLVSNVNAAHADLDFLTPDYGKLRKAAIHPLPGGGKAFAGVAKDPFWFDARLFSEAEFGLGILPPLDLVGAFNVNSIVLQVPKKDLALKGDIARNPVIGVWATAFKKSISLDGKPATYRQISRMGTPNATEFIIADNPILTKLTGGPAEAYNQRPADQDQHDATFLGRVRDPFVPKLINLTNLGFAGAPAAPRDDLKEIMLTGIGTATGGPIKDDLNSVVMNKDAAKDKLVPADMLRLNMSTPVSAKPATDGYLGGDRQGYPNGRRLTDDGTVIGLRILLGEPVRKASPKVLSITPYGPSWTRTTTTFPYVSQPNLRWNS